MGKYIRLVSFQINSPINHTVRSWAAPEDNRLQALGDLKLWIDMARTLERGLFDAIFIADELAPYTTYKGNSDPVVKFLADNGANLDAKDRQGRTALDMALGKGGRGRAGEAPKVRDSTVTLLRQLMETKLSAQ